MQKMFYKRRHARQFCQEFVGNLSRRPNPKAAASFFGLPTFFPIALLLSPAGEAVAKRGRERAA